MMITKKRNRFNTIFLLSGTIATGFMSLGSTMTYKCIAMLITFITLVFLKKYTNPLLLELRSANLKLKLGSLVVSIACSLRMVDLLYYINIWKISSRVSVSPFVSQLTHWSPITYFIYFGLALAALPFIWVCFLWVYSQYINKVRLFFKQMDSFERMSFIIFGTFFIISTFIIFNMTNAFYSPVHNGESIVWDVLYTSDTGRIFTDNSYISIFAEENDIRQPLFGLFSMPFSIPVSIVSSMLTFIPNIYPILMNALQIVLLQVSIILISRMLQLNKSIKLAFLIIANSTYSVMFFSFCMEQYVFSLFWLCLFLYAVVKNHDNREFMFIAASGTLITSFVLLPIAVSKTKMKEYLFKLLKICLVFVLLIIVFGQILELVDAIKSMSTMFNQYAGTKVAFTDRVKQYLSFVASCFIHPDAGIVAPDSAHPSWQLLPITSYNVLGAMILFVAFLGGVLNYKDKFTQICIVWAIFSFILLPVLGLGTVENGLVLYSLYFFWAYLSLVVKGVSKIFSRIPVITTIIFTIIAISLFCLNMPEIIKVVHFGMVFYPE